MNQILCLNEHYTQNICWDLIKNHFPDLKGTSIFTNIVESPQRSNLRITADTAGFFRDGYFLRPHYTFTGQIPQDYLMQYNFEEMFKGMFKGILGHELSHISLGDCHPLNPLRFSFGERINKFIEKKVEERADRETIRRGLGNELLQFALYAEKRNPLRNSQSKGYLSAQQIKKILENIF